MDIKNARYTDAKHTSITATIDGEERSIPADPRNRHYRELLKQGPPAAYVAPVKTVDEQRREDLEAAGVTTEKMVEALWAKVVDGKPDAVSGVAEIKAALAG